jgi:hypothetical protein
MMKPEASCTGRAVLAKVVFEFLVAFFCGSVSPVLIFNWVECTGYYILPLVGQALFTNPKAGARIWLICPAARDDQSCEPFSTCRRPCLPRAPAAGRSRGSQETALTRTDIQTRVRYPLKPFTSPGARPSLSAARCTSGRAGRVPRRSSSAGRACTCRRASVQRHSGPAPQLQQVHRRAVAHSRHAGESAAAAFSRQ